MTINKYDESDRKNKKKSNKIGFCYTHSKDNDAIYLDEKKANSDYGLLRHIEYYPEKDMILMKDGQGASIPFSVKELASIVKISKKHEEVYKDNDIQKRIKKTHKQITDMMDSIDETQKKLGLLKSKSSAEEKLSFTVPDEVLSDPDEDYMRVSDAPISAFLPFEEDYDLLDL